MKPKVPVLKDDVAQYRVMPSIPSGVSFAALARTLIGLELHQQIFLALSGRGRCPGRSCQPAAVLFASMLEKQLGKLSFYH
jgi:hypothetical protein